MRKRASQASGSEAREHGRPTSAPQLPPSARRRRRPAPSAQRVRRALPTVGLYIVSIAVALVLCGILVGATRGSATKVFSALLDGSIRSPGAWGLTITTAVPLLVVAVGTIVPSQAGLVEHRPGRAAAARRRRRGVRRDTARRARADPAHRRLPRRRGGRRAVGRHRGGDEVHAQGPRGHLHLAAGLHRPADHGLPPHQAVAPAEPGQGAEQQPTPVEPLPAAARLPKITIFGNSFSSGAILALLLAFAVAFLVSRTTAGFRLRMLGLQPANGPARRRVGRRLRRHGARGVRRLRRAGGRPLAHRRSGGRPVQRLDLLQHRLAGPAGRPARPRPGAGGDPDGVRVRRPANRVRLPRRDRRRTSHRRCRAGDARARPARSRPPCSPCSVAAVPRRWAHERTQTHAAKAATA